MSGNDRDAVLKAAKTANLLSADGQELRKVDSLSLIEFVLELEAETGLEIPPGVLRQEVFATVETVTAMIQQLR